MRFKFPATCAPFIVPYPHHQQHRIWHRIEGHDAVRCDATNYSMRWGAMPKQHRLDAGGWRCWQPWTYAGDMDGFAENDLHNALDDMADGTIASGTVYSDVEGHRQNPELKMIMALMEMIDSRAR